MILRYGLMKRFKRGVPISVCLTYDCNLKCPYCINGDVSSKTFGFEDWVKFFNKFPYKIREVLVSGGTAELHPDFIKIMKWLLNKGYFVQLYTNLVKIDILRQLPKTHRLIIISTYHHVVRPEIYSENYKELSKSYRIISTEIGEGVFSYSRVKPFSTLKDEKDEYPMIRVAPDFRMFCNCYDLIKK